jgi:hypothetical protein
LARLGVAVGPLSIIDPKQNQSQRHTTVSDGKDEIQDYIEMPFIGEAGRRIYKLINVLHERLLSWEYSSGRVVTIGRSAG